MTSLIERIESAEGPSRELDAEIQRVMGPDFPLYFSGVGICNAFTASIDAALTLVPEGMGFSLDVSSKPPRTAAAMLRSQPEWTYAATPALALCAAALRARGEPA